MAITPSERQDRIKKLELIKEKGIMPYADKFERSHSALEAREIGEGKQVAIAGRVMLFREMGKLAFAHVQDYSGRVQVVFKSDELPEGQFKEILKIVDLGDFIGVEGETFVTHKGEPSVLVKKFTFLSKALRPLPDKFHGLKDVETKYRKRYLDLIMNDETRDRFKFRSDFIWELRSFYREHGFQEVDTPVLCNTPSGALAKPFKTHHNALNIDVFLRIAPEIYLKEAIIGGYEKIFEIGRAFRNEGMDPSHLQDFSMVEHYCAYWDYKKNMDFTEEMLTTIIGKLKGSLKFEIMNRTGEMVEVDFSSPWKRVSFRELLIADSGIDIDQYPTVEDLRAVIKEKGIEVEDMDKLGRGNLIDSLYKVVSRPKLVNPVFLTSHPLDLSPLARKNDENPLITDRFQLVVNGWEIVNAYSELTDPIDQSERFAQQGKAREHGDEEAMMKDDEYVEAMEYGMPPISGWGMGIERIVALLTAQPNLRDVVLFPLMRPEFETNEKSDELKVAVAVINRGVELEPWQKMNAVAHLSAAFAARSGKSLFNHDEIETQDEKRIKLNIGHAIMIKEADASAELARLASLAREKGLEVAEFTREMLETTNDKKVIQKTKEKTHDQIEYLGVLVFGNKKDVDELTKKFDLSK